MEVPPLAAEKVKGRKCGLICPSLCRQRDDHIRRHAYQDQPTRFRFYPGHSVSNDFVFWWKKGPASKLADFSSTLTPRPAKFGGFGYSVSLAQQIKGRQRVPVVAARETLVIAATIFHHQRMGDPSVNAAYPDRAVVPPAPAILSAENRAVSVALDQCRIGATVALWCCGK